MGRALHIERIFPLGRMLAVPPLLSETVLPGGVRLDAARVVVPGFPVAPGFAGDPVLPTVPGLLAVVPRPAVVVDFPVVAGLPVVPVREVVPGLVTPGFWPAVVAWPVVVVAAWLGAAA